jgi:hypothetical protein
MSGTPPVINFQTVIILTVLCVIFVSVLLGICGMAAFAALHVFARSLKLL